MRTLIMGLLVVGSTSAIAGAKDEFIVAAQKQCSISEDQAKKLATSGRTGTVAKFRLCLEPEQTLPNGCVLRCTKAESKIKK